MCYGTAKDFVWKERNSKSLSTASSVRKRTLKSVRNYEADSGGTLCLRTPVWNKNSRSKDERRENWQSPNPCLCDIRIRMCISMSCSIQHSDVTYTWLPSLRCPLIPNTHFETSVSNWEWDFKRSNWKLTFMWLSLEKMLTDLSVFN